MTIIEFYNQLTTLTIEAPTHELALAALQLQVAIDNLNFDQYDNLLEIIE